MDTVGRVLRVLLSCPHNGFPVIDRPPPDLDFSPTSETHRNSENFAAGGGHCTLRGWVTRADLIDQLLVVLGVWSGRNEDPRPKSFDLSRSELHTAVYVCGCMDPSPEKVDVDMSGAQVWRTFSTLHLRHLPVVDSSNCIRGVITRVDLIAAENKVKNMVLTRYEQIKDNQERREEMERRKLQVVTTTTDDVPAGQASPDMTRWG